jgi:hypothetical protein
MARDSEAHRAWPTKLLDASTLAPESPNQVHFENYSHKWRGTSLIYLLQKFRAKECSDPRDRVFSLLALCGEGAELQVDYAATLEDLGKAIHRACSASFCLCAVYMVTSAVLARHLGSYRDSYTRDLRPFAQLTLSRYMKRYALGVEPMEVDMRARRICASFDGVFRLRIHRLGDMKVEVTGSSVTCHFLGCSVAATHQWHDEEGPQLLYCAYSMSYCASTSTWDIDFPYGTLAKMAAIVVRKRTVELCSNAKGRRVNPDGELWSPLRLSEPSEPDTRPPNLDHLSLDNVPLGSGEPASFDLRPYLHTDGRIMHHATLVYDQKHDADRLDYVKAYVGGRRAFPR